MIIGLIGYDLLYHQTSESKNIQTQLFEESLDYIKPVWLYQFTKLGVADKINQISSSAESAFSLHQIFPNIDSNYVNILERMLLACESIGLIDRLPDNKFQLTHRGNLTSSSHPDSLKNWILLQWEGDFIPCTFQTVARIIEGSSSELNQINYQCNFYETLQTSTYLRSVFDKSMEEFTHWQKDSLLNFWDWGSECSNICDVAGGSGYLLEILLDKYPNLFGTLLDLPESLHNVRKSLLKFGDRVNLIPFDMFNSSNYRKSNECDCYTMKGITSDWSDIKIQQIFTNIKDLFSVRKTSHKLILIDHFISNRKSHLEQFKRKMDTLMMTNLNVNAKQRSTSQIVALAKEKLDIEKYQLFTPKHAVPLEMIVLHTKGN